MRLAGIWLLSVCHVSARVPGTLNSPKHLVAKDRTRYSISPVTTPSSAMDLTGCWHDGYQSPAEDYWTAAIAQKYEREACVQALPAKDGSERKPVEYDSGASSTRRFVYQNEVEVHPALAPPGEGVGYAALSQLVEPKDVRVGDSQFGISDWPEVGISYWVDRSTAVVPGGFQGPESYVQMPSRSCAAAEVFLRTVRYRHVVYDECPRCLTGQL